MKTSTVKPNFYVVIAYDKDSAEEYADIEYSLKDCMRTHPTIVVPVKVNMVQQKKFTGTVLPLQTIK